MSENGRDHKSRKKKSDRPENDLYHTPMCCSEKLIEIEHFTDVSEPASGDGAIYKPFKKAEIKIKATDIKKGKDFLKSNDRYSEIVTNPPFDLWDDFVIKAKSLNPKKICFIGQTDYFGTYGRGEAGIWRGLARVHVFNRKIDYRTPYREDGLFHVGAMTSGWFVWDKNHFGHPIFTFVDVQEWAKLGQYKDKCEYCKNGYLLAGLVRCNVTGEMKKLNDFCEKGQEKNFDKI